MATEAFGVQVVYAKENEQLVIPLQVSAGTQALEAVERSGILERCPEIDRDKLKLGVFGKVVKRDATLGPGDRVEIYRPLIADPKEARKKRAAEGKQLKKGGGSLPAKEQAE